MKLTPSGGQTAVGSADWFTGSIHIDGIGYVATRAAGVHEIRPGDVVYIEPAEEHWHGATSDRFMAHLAIQEADEDGQVVTWLDHVTDAEYSRAEH